MRQLFTTRFILDKVSWWITLPGIVWRHTHTTHTHCNTILKLDITHIPQKVKSFETLLPFTPTSALHECCQSPILKYRPFTGNQFKITSRYKIHKPPPHLCYIFGIWIYYFTTCFLWVAWSMTWGIILLVSKSLQLTCLTIVQGFVNILPTWQSRPVIVETPEACIRGGLSIMRLSLLIPLLAPRWSTSILVVVCILVFCILICTCFFPYIFSWEAAVSWARETQVYPTSPDDHCCLSWMY